MPSDPSPMLRRRQAGIRLRQLRESAGKSLSEVAAYLECSAAKISRVETGRLLARIPDVRNMLDLYEVTETERAELLDLVRESREKGWWQNDFADIVDETWGQFLGLEHSAAQMWQYEEYLLPGLLQTRDYASTLAANRPDLAQNFAERNVQLRMERQRILNRPEPPDLHFVLDESVLHRVAALGPTTGREQLDHLRELAERPNISLQVVPFSVGIACHVSFLIFGFPDPADPKVVCFDGLSEITIDARVKTVGECMTNFDVVRSIALDEERSATLIRRIGASVG